jgi:Ca2+-binding RTX toxin-like protein
LAFTRNPLDPTVSPATYTADGPSELFLSAQQRDIAVDGSEEDDLVSIISAPFFGLGGIESPALYNYNVRAFAGDDEISISTSLLQDSVINGNQGDDVMDIEANNMSGSYFLGGKGDDDIHADASFLRGSLSNGEVNGNIGNDFVGIGRDAFDFSGDFDPDELASFSDLYVGGGQGNDVIEIVGDFTDSIIDGNKGDDIIDVIAGDHSSSSVNGGEGNDVIRTANSLFEDVTSGLVLNGDIGNDTILAIGGSGVTVTGGEGNDTIAVGGEDSFLNTVDGGVGADFVQLTGEDSRETYIFDQGDSVAATETDFDSFGVEGTLSDSSLITFEDGVDVFRGASEFDKIEFDFSPANDSLIDNDGELVSLNNASLLETTFANVVYEVEGFFDYEENVFEVGEDGGDYMYIAGGSNLTLGQVFTNNSNIIITDTQFELSSSGALVAGAPVLLS